MDTRICLGSVCDDKARCDTAGRCCYRSSSQEALERMGQLTLFPQPAPVAPVEDFSGTVDGKGVKSVMAQPKTEVALIDPRFIEGMGEVLLFGKKKYAANNWLRGMSWVTVLGGVLRHVLAFARGEELDKETGLPHLHHAACGLMFVAHYAHVEREKYQALDDRVFT